ncbi:MAG: GNAT family N-acetyltransferase [Methanothrix sp.]|nr:GNAT family N-acetyltransferase [Methanothrix sp.]
MTDVSYIEVDEQGLDLIKPLWEKLIEHIIARSVYFGEWFEARAFEQRKSELLRKSSAGKMHIGLALVDGEYVGYCVSSVCCRAGEIDSIFVEESHRACGIGGEMMKQALAWMEKEQAVRINIAVSVGNEEALPFYQRYGFFPKHILLEPKK